MQAIANCSAANSVRALILAARMSGALGESRLTRAMNFSGLRRQHLLGVLVNINGAAATPFNHAREQCEEDKSDTRDDEAVADRSSTGLRIRACILHALAEGVGAPSVASGDRARVRQHALLQCVRLRLPASRERALEERDCAQVVGPQSGFAASVLHSPDA